MEDRTRRDMIKMRRSGNSWKIESTHDKIMEEQLRWPCMSNAGREPKKKKT